MNDLSRAYQANPASLMGAIADVISSGWYSLGHQVQHFEREFARFVGAAHAIGVASGSDALELCLRAVGCGPGDEVVTAANAGMYATLAILRVGATPRFADVSLETLNLSAASVEATLTDKSKAVVVTHLYGRLADVERIVEICSDRGLALIEDCAQAVGASRHGQRAGTFGVAAAFSFYPTKNLAAVGDAGAVTTSDDEIAEVVRSLRQYGWSDRYCVERPCGINSRLDEVQAAVLRSRMPDVDVQNEHRRNIAMRYAEAVSPRNGRLLVSAQSDYVGHLAVLLCNDRRQMQGRFTTARISTAVHYPIPDHRQPVFQGRYRHFRLPVTESTVEKIISIPLFPELREDEISRIEEVLSL